MTGERTLPGIGAENYWFQRHVAEYRFAATVARGRVLDAGSGEGYGTALLAGAAIAAGLDADRQAVAHAARAYPRAAFAVADLCAIPIRAGSLDAVVCIQVIEHLHCAAGFVRACRRALSPGGILVVATPNRPTFTPGSAVNPFHVHEYDASELQGLLGTAFDRVHLYGLRHGPRLALIDRLLGEPVPRRLIRGGWAGTPSWVRSHLRGIGPRSFRIAPARPTDLDLLAVCGGVRRGARPGERSKRLRPRSEPPKGRT